MTPLATYVLTSGFTRTGAQFPGAHADLRRTPPKQFHSSELIPAFAYDRRERHHLLFCGDLMI